MKSVNLNGREYVLNKDIVACKYCKYGDAMNEDAIKACYNFHEAYCGIEEKFEPVKKDGDGKE